MQARSFGCVAKAFFIVATLTLASLASAEPSLQDVNQALKNGNISRAEMLMKEVLSVHPESAKAHFKYSEILAAEGRIADAQTELTKAEKIQPGLAFVKPEAVNALKHKLYKNDIASNSTTSNDPSSANPLLKWAGLAFVIFLAAMAFKAFRRPQIQPNYATNPQTPNTYGPQPGNPMQNVGQGGGIGSGIVGGLATGAAVGAGIVAGEMLMHKILDGDHNKNDNSDVVNNEPTHDSYNDISGNEFVDSGNSSWDNDSSISDSSFDSDNSGDWS